MQLAIKRTPDMVELDDDLVRSAVKEYVERSTRRAVTDIQVYGTIRAVGKVRSAESTLHAKVTLADDAQPRERVGMDTR